MTCVPVTAPEHSQTGSFYGYLRRYNPLTDVNKGTPRAKCSGIIFVIVALLLCHRHRLCRELAQTLVVDRIDVAVV